jgi:excinuclease ABC subunit A
MTIRIFSQNAWITDETHWESAFESPFNVATIRTTLAVQEFSRSALRMARDILITGARVNTLKNVQCRIPHESLTVITGLSGSGKSSLAFDTLYAEGQRRYVESLSSYARQFLARIEKPDVDQIQNILPAIALEQKNRVKNARSTVGTATDIYDYLRILYAAIGKTFCTVCGAQVEKGDPYTIVQHLSALSEGSRLVLTAPVPVEPDALQSALEKGFYRYLDKEGQIQELPTDPEGLDGFIQKTRQKKTPPITSPPSLSLSLVVDRVVMKTGKAAESRLLESIKTTQSLSGGQVHIHVLADKKTEASAENTVLTFQAGMACQSCQIPYLEPYPEMFSFNSPRGACPTCEGFGRVMGLDLDRVIPNKSLSLLEGAIHPFTTPANRELQDTLEIEGKKRKLRLGIPFKELNGPEMDFVMHGAGTYPGILPFFDWLDTKRYKVHVRVMLARYRGYTSCPDCLGSRLVKQALNVSLLSETFGKQSIWDLGQLPIHRLLAFFNTLVLTPSETDISARLWKEIVQRLTYLNNVGLGYLTLSRQMRTLSGGESQRIHLSSALGSMLTDTLYVLDEPTVGLHSRDTQRLLGVLNALRDNGNTVVVVEHDAEVIQAADHIIDMGPASGEHGGHIVFEGDLPTLLKQPDSLTAQCLTGTFVEVSDSRTTEKEYSQAPGMPLHILGACGNNLKQLDVSIPTRQFVCITGVSGSGKSTLIKQTLFGAYQESLGTPPTVDVGSYRDIVGLEQFQEVVMVDQSPPARSVRSNPVTFVKAYDDIRTLFAQSRKAQSLGLTPGDFSFNTAGGRCETCEGLGTVTVDMQFMADVTMTCQECQGRRFNPAVLSIEWQEKNIDDVLNLTVHQAMAFFEKEPKVRKKLEPLQRIGLGYLKLGQSTNTLSGGEAQRLKLASYLKDTSTRVTGQKPSLFLFDEPTTGLHMADITVLVRALRSLLAMGHSVVVIEHNLELIAQADVILDLGPEGGDGGGLLVAQGTVQSIMDCPESITGQFLKNRLSSKGAIEEEVSGSVKASLPKKQRKKAIATA